MAADAARSDAATQRRCVVGASTPSLAADAADHSVSASLSALQPYTTYHFRLVATSGAGSSDGADQTFTTAPLAPEAQTGPASAVTRTGATLTGTVNPQGAPLTYHFEYGTTTAYGASTAELAAGSHSASVAESAVVAGLSSGTVYHYRIVARGPGGTVGGGDQVLYTPVSTTPTVSTGPPIKLAVAVAQRTALQRSVKLLATCAEDCRTTVRSLSVLLSPSNRSKLDAKHAMDLSVDLSISKQLSAGHRSTIAISLPLQLRAWISDVLEHGGQAKLTAALDVVDAHGLQFSVAQITLRQGGKVAKPKHPAHTARASAASGAATSAAGGDDVVPSGGTVVLDQLSLSEHPRPRHWQVTIWGRQTTTWHVNNDRTEGSCTTIAHGHGTQKITFKDQRPVRGYIGMSPAGIPLVAGENGTSPLDIPLDLRVNRRGSYDEGISGECPLASGGGGATPPASDCGERTASTQAAVEWLGPRDLHAAEDANYELLHPHGEIYKDCPFLGLTNAISGLDLWPAHDPDFPPKLVLTNTAQRHLVETLRANDRETLPGGYANTQVIYNVTLQLLECPPPLPGGLSAVCVDEKTKQQAEKDAADYARSQEYDANAIKIACKTNPANVEDARGTALACLADTVKDGYDNHEQQQNQAIANDPPDPRYRTIARAHAAKLGKLPKGSPPALLALVANQRQVAGLGRALATTINRISGAYEAKNARALKRQNGAAIHDARQMAALLSAQPKLMRRARQVLAARLRVGGRLLARAIDAPQEVTAARSTARMLRRLARQKP